MKKVAKASMYKLISFLFILSVLHFGLNLFGTALAYGQNIPQEVEQIQEGIVQIYTSNLNGTGFFISPDTLVTNFHIVVNKKGLLPIKTFRLSNGVKVIGVKALSPIDDLAILEVTNYAGETLKIPDFETTAKEVYMLGFFKEIFTTIKGKIKNKNDKDYRIALFGSLPYIKGLFPYYPGMSGGPVLDAKGNLIAITKSGELDILRASTSKSLRILLERSLAVSSNGKELFHTAMQELKQLAEQGDPVAQHILGDIYKKGKGVFQNYTEAHKWVKKAAEQGDPYAQLTLGFMYTKKGVLQNYTEAHKWVKKAAEQGLPQAQYTLGVMYTEKGVFQNYTEAHKWVKKAAEQGVPQAQLTLGFMYYLEGKSVPQNYTEAHKWVKKAAEQGIPLAQLLLGRMYQKGKGVPQNYTEAHQWVKEAAKQEAPLAKLYLRLISLHGKYKKADKWFKNTTEKVKRSCLDIFK